MLTVAIPKRNKLQNIIVLTPKDGLVYTFQCFVVSPPISTVIPWILDAICVTVSSQA